MAKELGSGLKILLPTRKLWSLFSTSNCGEPWWLWNRNTECCPTAVQLLEPPCTMSVSTCPYMVRSIWGQVLPSHYSLTWASHTVRLRSLEGETLQHSDNHMRYSWLKSEGLVQDCSNSIANTLELLQSCSKLSKYRSPILLGCDPLSCSLSELDRSQFDADHQRFKLQFSLSWPEILKKFPSLSIIIYTCLGSNLTDPA